MRSHLQNLSWCLVPYEITRCVYIYTFYTFEPGHKISYKIPHPHPRSLIRVFTLALWVAKDPKSVQADGEDSDQTAQMSRLMWVFAVRSCNMTGNAVSRLIVINERISQFSIVYFLISEWFRFRMSNSSSSVSQSSSNRRDNSVDSISHVCPFVRVKKM